MWHTKSLRVMRRRCKQCNMTTTAGCLSPDLVVTTWQISFADGNVQAADDARCWLGACVSNQTVATAAAWATSDKSFFYVCTMKKLYSFCIALIRHTLLRNYFCPCVPFSSNILYSSGIFLARGQCNWWSHPLFNHLSCPKACCTNLKVCQKVRHEIDWCSF